LDNVFVERLWRSLSQCWRAEPALTHNFVAKLAHLPGTAVQCNSGTLGTGTIQLLDHWFSRQIWLILAALLRTRSGGLVENATTCSAGPVL
jgi:hypothetical protein